MTVSQHLGSIIIPSKTPLLFICLIVQIPSVGSSSREEKCRQRIGSFNFGNSQSLVGSCLDCRVHKVTLPTHNREVFFFVTTSAICGRALSSRFSGPAMSNWDWFLCIFLRSFCSHGSRKFFNMLHDGLLQENLTQASHFFHLLMFLAFLVLGHCLCSHNHHKN